MIVVGAIDGGDEPSVPGTPTATNGQNASSVVTFAPSAYIGKGTISYIVTASPGNISRTGNSPVEVTGLTNGVSYTFTVTGVTDYGVYSQTSAASAAITPAAPAPINPCAGCLPAGTLLGSGCTGTTLYYAYADGCCGVGSTIPIQYDSPTCGYVPPPPAPVPGCSTCNYTVTGQSQFTCGCADIRFISKQKFYVVTYYSTTCSPDPCSPCVCPQSSTGACTQSNYACFE
jgi:hypothetical protein